MGQAELAEAEELRAQAVQAFSAGRPAVARRLIARALLVIDTFDGPDALRLAARIQVSRALTEFERSGLDAALQALDEAAALAERAGSLDIPPLVHSQRATFLLRSGDLTAALAELNRAARHIARMAARDQVVVLLNRGTLFMQLGSQGQARRDLRRAAELGMLHAIDDLTWKARNNLAYLEYIAGDLPTSLQGLRAVAETVPDRHPGIPMDLARVLMEAGLVSEAQAQLALAESLAKQRGLKHERGEALVELAQASLLRGELSDARAQAGQARRLFQQRGSEGWIYQSELVAVLADVISGRRATATVRRADDLARRFAAVGARDLETYASFLGAEACVTANQVPQAQALIRRAEQGLRTLSQSRRLYANLVRAKVAHAAGERAQARRVMRRAADDLALAQGRSASLDLRAAVSLHGRRLAEFALTMAMENGSARTAFEVAERWRAVSNRLPPVQPSDDPVVADLTSQLRQLRDQQRGVSQARNEATAQIALLQRQIRERDWHGVGEKRARVTRPISVGRLQQLLHSRRAELVTYFSHRTDLYAVVITPREVKLTSVGEIDLVTESMRRTQADLHALNHAMHPAIAGSVRASLSHRLLQIDDRLLTALPLSADRLVVVPSYAVAGLPWGMLPSRVGRPTTVARSATTWASADPPAGSAATAVYAVAGPGLALADEEVDAVAALWPSAEAVHAKESNQAGLVQALRSRSVVHIAAHGEHEAENPLFSSVRLSDGVLFAHELQRGGVTAEHVILSACDAGRATIRPGDEALGLTASLLALGAKNVVAAVAPVPDVVAHRVMVAYHEHLAAGLDVSAALAQASLVDDLGGLFCSFGSDWIRT